MPDGFDSTPDDLRGAARTIGDVINELGEGRVSDLSPGGSDYGHDGLHGALTEFLTTADGAVVDFLDAATSAGSALGFSATDYRGVDDVIQSVFGGQ